ncbi:hypothetical protein NL676_010385 [Syzygium grande]|nr:hypothetical protein NL676_010385 [Syzygium grande]
MESTQLQENPSPLSRSQWRHIPIRIYLNQRHSISCSLYRSSRIGILVSSQPAHRLKHLEGAAVRARTA